VLFIIRFFFDNDNQPLYVLIGEPHNSVMYISPIRVAPPIHKIDILCVSFAACTFVFPPKFQFSILFFFIVIKKLLIVNT